MSRNPYHLEGKGPSLRLSVLAYFDILGYTEIVRDASRAGTQQEALARIYSAMSGGRDWLEEKKHALPELNEFIKKDRFALKAFTDNIVIGWPVRDDAESELGDALGKLGDFQFIMALNGFFVRGAISIGNAYVDEIAVFGDALLEAYDAESKVARDPRIVLTPSAIEASKSHLEYYHPPSGAPHVHYLLQDADGQWFINYLEAVLWLEDGHGPFYDEFLKHKAVVEQKLSEYKSKPAIWSKYAWVAGYHNYFCDAHGGWFNDEHKINLELFRALPRLIVD